MTENSILNAVPENYLLEDENFHSGNENRKLTSDHPLMRSSNIKYLNFSPTPDLFVLPIKTTDFQTLPRPPSMITSFSPLGWPKLEEVIQTTFKQKNGFGISTNKITADFM